MLKRFIVGCALLMALGAVSGCSETFNYLDQPETGRKFTGQPGRKYTMDRRGYVIRQNLIYAIADLDRILMLDKPSMVHEDFVDY